MKKNETKLKIPSPEVIAEMNRDWETTITLSHQILAKHCPEFSSDYVIWANRERRKTNLKVFEDFFHWYELSQTPLYKALNEEDP